MVGVAAFRPAVTFRCTGMAHFAMRIREAAGLELSDFLKMLKVDASKPGRLMLGPEAIEWVTCGIEVGHGGNAENQNLHSIQFGGLTVRTTRPFDWLAFLRG